MTKRPKKAAKTPAKGFKEPEKHKYHDPQLSDDPLHEANTSSLPYMSREKHNKKSWYISEFTDPTTNQTYNCAEQYMMHQKAVSRNDEIAAAAILNTPYPKEQKDLGRAVANWDDAAWDEIKEKVVEEGSYMKFSQNKKLRDMLLMTGDRDLVEASASDRIWGVGFNAKSALSRREDWGTNLLGRCLMKARERIREDEKRKLSDKEAL